MPDPIRPGLRRRVPTGHFVPFLLWSVLFAAYCFSVLHFDLQGVESYGLSPFLTLAGSMIVCQWMSAHHFRRCIRAPSTQAAWWVGLRAIPLTYLVGMGMTGEIPHFSALIGIVVVGAAIDILRLCTDS